MDGRLKHQVQEAAKELQALLPRLAAKYKPASVRMADFHRGGHGTACCSRCRSKIIKEEPLSDDATVMLKPLHRLEVTVNLHYTTHDQGMRKICWIYYQALSLLGMMASDAKSHGAVIVREFTPLACHALPPGADWKVLFEYNGVAHICDDYCSILYHQGRLKEAVKLSRGFMGELLKSNSSEPVRKMNLLYGLVEMLERTDDDSTVDERHDINLKPRLQLVKDNMGKCSARVGR